MSSTRLALASSRFHRSKAPKSGACAEPLESRIAPAYTFSLTGTTATATGGTTVDHLVIEAVGGLLEYSVNGAAFSNDWDGGAQGANTLAAAAGSTVNISVSTGDGSTLTFGTPAGPASELFATFNVVATNNTLDTVLIDDSGGTAAQTYTVDTAPGTITGTGIHYNEGGSAAFRGGTTIKGSPVTGDIFNVNSVFGSEPITLIAGTTGASTVNVGNGGVLTVASPLSVQSAGSTVVLNINDQSDTAHGTATLDNQSGNATTPYEVTGLSTSPIEYGSGVTALNIFGGTHGAGGVTFNINNTQAGTTTTITGGAQQNFINLSNATETGGLDNLPGPVVVHGGTSLTDVVTLEDSSANFNDTYTITSTTVSRATFGGLTYDGNIGTLTLNAENTLGTNGNNTININSTANTVTTNINGQGGADTINVNGTGSLGVLNLTTGSGSSTVNVLADSEPVSIIVNGTDVLNIGSSGGSGTLANILDAVSVTGGGTATLNLYDQNDTSHGTATLDNLSGNAGAPYEVTGLSAGAIQYGAVVTAVNLAGGTDGTAGVTFDVNDTQSGTVTAIIGGPNANVVNVGTGGLLAGILGAVAVTDPAGSTTLSIDDHADTSNGTATLDNLSGIAGAPYEVTGLSAGIIAYGGGVTAVNLTGGTAGGAGVTFNINNTQVGTTTTLTGGPDQNFFNLSNAGEAGGLDNLPGPVVVHGGTSLTDVVTLEDSSANFNDTYTITSTTVSRVVFGGLTYDGNIGTLTLNAENTLGTNGNNTININSTANSVTTNINGQGGADTINVNGTGSLGVLNLTTGSGSSTVNVLADSEPVNIIVHGIDVLNIGSSGGSGTLANILDAVSVTGAGTATLNLYDQNDTSHGTATLDNLSGNAAAPYEVTGLSAGAIQYGAAVTAVNLTGGTDGTGGVTFDVNDTQSGTVTAIIGGPNPNVVNVGTGGLLAGILGAVAVTDTTLSGSVTLNIDDHADTSNGTATLDNLSGNTTAPFEVMGLSAGVIEYGAGVTAVNLIGGTAGGGGVTFNINNTQSGTTTTITGGPDQNFFNLSNAGEVNGLDNLPGPVVVHGGASLSDVVTLEDSSANFNDTYTITATTVSRTVFGGLTYDGNIGTLTLNAENALGTNGNNTIIINSTANSVTTNINGQGGADTIDVNGTGSLGTLNITTGSGGSTVNVLADSEPVNISDFGTDTVNIGSGGGPGILANILDTVSVAGGGRVTLNLYDQNDTSNGAATLDNLASSGSTPFEVLGLSPGAIQYGYNILAVNLYGGTNGTAGVVFNVNDTAILANTTINGGPNPNTFYLSNASLVDGLDNLVGPIVINGGTSLADAVILDDSSADFDDTYTITNTTVSRFAFGGLTYASIGSLTLNAENNLGSLGDNLIEVNSTAAGVLTTVNGQGGDDNIDLGTGDLNALAGPIVISGGSGTNKITLDDSANPSQDTYTITATTVSRTGGFGGLTYDNTIQFLSLLGESGGNIYDINGTQAGALTTITGGAGNDVFNLSAAGQASGLNALAGPLVVHGGGGTDAVNVYDLDATVADTYTITNTTVSRTGGFGGLTYDAGMALTVTDANGGHTFILDGWTTSGSLVNTGTIGDTLSATKSAGYTLTNTLLTATDGLSASLTGLFNTANLTDTAGGAHTFDVSGWTGGGSLTSQGGSDTLVASKIGGGTLSNTNLTTDDGLDMGLSGITTANLTDTAGGSHTFTVSGWTGDGSLTSQGGSDTVTAAKSGGATLTNSQLTTDDGLSMTLSGIGTANLTDTSGGGHIFTVSGWTHGGSLTSVGGSDSVVSVKIGGGTLVSSVGSTPGQLQTDDGMNLALSNIGTANLTDTAGGSHVFTVSGWTGSGSITSQGGSDTIVATKAANVVLDNTLIYATDGMDLTLSGLQTAKLTAGLGNIVLDARYYTGNLTLTGSTTTGVKGAVAGKNSDTFIAGIGVNTLIGGSEADRFVLTGLSVSDSVTPSTDGPLAVKLPGTSFEQRDLIDYSNATDGISINLSKVGVVQAVNRSATLAGKGLLTLHGLIGDLWGSNFNDILTGNSLVNVIYSGKGTDTLAGNGVPKHGETDYLIGNAHTKFTHPLPGEVDAKSRGGLSPFIAAVKLIMVPAAVFTQVQTYGSDPALVAESKGV